jgi:hypothetical protein
MGLIRLFVKYIVVGFRMIRCKLSNNVEQLQMNDIMSDTKCKVIKEFQIGLEYEEMIENETLM